jgi:hypothetical protein
MFVKLAALQPEVDSLTAWQPNSLKKTKNSTNMKTVGNILVELL